MIVIFSTDSDGRMFTDKKRHFYIDAETLRQKAIAVKTAATLDKIAAHFGFHSFDNLKTSAACAGIPHDALISLILAGRFEYITTMMGGMKK